MSKKHCTKQGEMISETELSQEQVEELFSLLISDYQQFYKKIWKLPKKQATELARIFRTGVGQFETIINLCTHEQSKKIGKGKKVCQECGMHSKLEEVDCDLELSATWGSGKVWSKWYY